MLKRFLRRDTPGWPELIDEVFSHATMPFSNLHGEEHWRAVGRAGLRICSICPSADPRTVLAFALIHDSQRFDEAWDPEHGDRAAALAGRLKTLPCLLDGGNIKMLQQACHLHEKGQTTAISTIGTCWDADRLNLWRVGVTPDPAYFSVLKNAPEFDGFSEDARQSYPEPPSWGDLVAELNTLELNRQGAVSTTGLL